MGERTGRAPGCRSRTVRWYGPFLLQEVNIIKPGVTGTLGRLAMTFVLEQCDLSDSGSRVGELHGEVLRADAPHGAVHTVPVYHLGATFNNPDLEAAMEDDFRVLGQFL